MHEQFPLDEIYDDQMRIARGWGSVEIFDKDNQMLPMSEFKKILPVIMKRGGVIIDQHSNRVIGKALNYEFKEHPEAKEEGCLLTYSIFDDFDLDDSVWKEIKSGERTGLSFGGRNHLKDYVFDKKSGLTKEILRKLEGYEFSSVKKPANPLALNTEVNMIAKSEKGDVKLEEIQKPFAEYKDFADCVAHNKDKDNPQAFCAFLHHKVTGAWPSEKSLETAKDLNQNDVNTNKKETEKMEVNKTDEILNVLKSLTDRVVALEKSFASKAEEKKPEEKEKPEEEAKKSDLVDANVTPPKPIQDPYFSKAEVAKTIADEVKKQVEEIKKSMKVAAPDRTEVTDVKKSVAESKKADEIWEIAKGIKKTSFAEIELQNRAKQETELKGFLGR